MNLSTYRRSPKSSFGFVPSNLVIAVSIAVAVSAAACSGSSDSKGTTGGTAGTTNTGGTTSTLPLNLTGTWIGVAPDGVTYTPGADAGCDSDLQLSLTQVGTALSGTATFTVRSTNNSGCQIGAVSTMTFTNVTVSGTAVSFPYNDASGTLRATFSGSVSGNGLTGVVIGSGGGSQVGTFAVTRQ